MTIPRNDEFAPNARQATLAFAVVQELKEEQVAHQMEAEDQKNYHQVKRQKAVVREPEVEGVDEEEEVLEVLEDSSCVEEDPEASSMAR